MSEPSEPWGHKVTFVIYVPGDEQTAERVADEVVFPAGVEFVGTTIDPVQDQPADQPVDQEGT